MKRALVAALAVLLVGCAGAPMKLEERTAPQVLPNGYHDPGREAPLPPECGTVEGRKQYDPKRTLNPAGGLRDAAGALTGEKLRSIREKGLTVGVSQTTPLLSRRDQVTGRMEGYEIDIINRIAAELFGEDLGPDDPRLRLVTMPTGSRLLALDTPKNRALRASDKALDEVPEVDIVVADVTMTCDRVFNHDIMYSAPYLNTNAGILSRKGSAKRDTLADLRGKKVCAASGTTSISDLHRAKDSTGLLPVSVPDSSECLMLLQRGLVEAVYTDYPILQGLQLQDPGAHLVDLRNQGGGMAGIAISKDDTDLVRFVNGVLAEMRADGSMVLSRDTWFVEKVAAAGLSPGTPLDLPPVSYVD